MNGEEGRRVAKPTSSRKMRSALLEIAMLPHAEYQGDHVVGHDRNNCGPCMATEALNLCGEVDYRDQKYGEGLDRYICVAQAEHRDRHRWRQT